MEILGGTSRKGQIVYPNVPRDRVRSSGGSKRRMNLESMRVQRFRSMKGGYGATRHLLLLYSVVACLAAVLAALLDGRNAFAQSPSSAPSLDFLNGNRALVDAHNCYPYEGRWNDRVTRALRSGYPVSIEQDLAWYVDPATGAGRVVVSIYRRLPGPSRRCRRTSSTRCGRLWRRRWRRNIRRLGL